MTTAEKKHRGRGQAEHGSISTQKEVDALKPKVKEYSKGDSGSGTRSLRLFVKPNGIKTWKYFYTFKGKQDKLTIGPVGIAEARAEVDKARILIRKGVSPNAAKRALKAAMRGAEKRVAQGGINWPTPLRAP